LGEPLIKEKLGFVDVETTGLEPGYHEIVEVAVVVVDPVTDHMTSFNARILPMYEIRAEPKALEVNGYSSERWHNGNIPLINRYEAMRGVARMLKGCKFVAHSAGFDHAFLNAEMKRMELPPLEVNHHLLDTKSMAWPLYQRGDVRDTHLATLCDYFGISNEGAHTAMADVRRMMALYAHLTED
jgi:DNA polymerase-3 subunit epsilon